MSRLRRTPLDSSGIATLHPVAGSRRALVDLVVAFGTAVGLLLLNISVNFSDELHRFFGEHAHSVWVPFAINVLFFWLAVMLWVAFMRWRYADRHGRELEVVLSSISPDALLVVDPQRVIQLCNSSVERIFGYRMSEVLGQRTDLLYGDRRRNPGRVHEIYDALEKEGFHVGSATGRRKDGRAVPLEIISADLRGHGGAVLLLRDISDRERVESERRGIEARMHQRQKLESLGLLAGGIAHDFNNLLMVVIGHADLLKLNPDATGPLRATMDEVQGAAMRASELCRELLAYSGKGKFEIRALDLSDVVREMVKFLDVAIPKKIERRFDLARGLPAVRADVAQVRQIVVNLITNAADAIGDAAGAITLRTGVCECDDACLRECAFAEGAAPGRYVTLTVSDDGCGMDEGTMARIFDPFFSTKREGRGLGLASVQGIIRGHNGALRLVSEPGKGTTFTVLLPAAEGAEADVEARPEGVGEWRGSGTALVVDDEKPVLALVARMLQALGMEAVLAQGGEEALREFRARGGRFACVLADMNMPRMSGAELYRALRKESPDLPILLSSGLSDAAGCDLGGDPKARFVQKPYDLQVMARLLRELTSAR